MQKRKNYIKNCYIHKETKYNKKLLRNKQKKKIKQKRNNYINKLLKNKQKKINTIQK